MEKEPSVKEKALEDLLLNPGQDFIFTDFSTVYGSNIIQPEACAVLVVDGWEVKIEKPNQFQRWVQRVFLGMTWRKL